MSAGAHLRVTVLSAALLFPPGSVTANERLKCHVAFSDIMSLCEVEQPFAAMSFAQFADRAVRTASAARRLDGVPGIHTTEADTCFCKQKSHSLSGGWDAHGAPYLQHFRMFHSKIRFYNGRVV